MLMHPTILLFVIGAFASTGHCTCDDTDDSQYPNLCHEILQSLEQALIDDKGNIYRCRKAFFYAPNADPVLMKVEYNISFSENITASDCINDNSSIPIALNQTKIIRGWTSRGIYLMINPLDLNYFQMTLPLAVLRLIHKKTHIKGNPEVETFLWDGSYELPTLFINLYITFLPCIPSVKVFNSTIEDLNTFLKVYAFQRSFDTINHNDIGFTLSEESMSFHVYPTQKFDFISAFDLISYICGYLIFGGMLLILTLIVMFIITVKKHFLEYVKNVLIDYHYFIRSMIIVGSAILFGEFVAMCIYRKYNPIPSFQLIVWLFIFSTYGMMFLCLCFSKYTGGSNFSATIIVLHHLILYLLVIYIYSLPTFLLILVYPTKVIAIVAYLIMYVFSGIMICSILILLWKQTVHQYSTRSTNQPNTYCIHLYNCILFTFCFFSLLVSLGMVFPLVYALVFGQLSAVTAGPYTVLSLIPSAAISLSSWMVKAKVFGKKELHLHNKSIAINTELYSEGFPNSTNANANDHDNNEDDERTMLLAGTDSG